VRRQCRAARGVDVQDAFEGRQSVTLHMAPYAVAVLCRMRSRCSAVCHRQFVVDYQLTHSGAGCPMLALASHGSARCRGSSATSIRRTSASTGSDESSAHVARRHSCRASARGPQEDCPAARVSFARRSARFGGQRRMSHQRPARHKRRERPRTRSTRESCRPTTMPVSSHSSPSHFSAWLMVGPAP